MRSLAALAVALFLLPSFAFAFPFGGQASTVVPCYNSAIFARLGAPRGGDYIWTPATKTYQFGPPSFAGQWLLGLASAPYYCVVSIEPVIVWAGIAIDMMGSSGGGSISNLLSSRPPTTSAPPAVQKPVSPGALPTPPASAPVTIGHVVASEVYYNVDTTHGTKPLNQWVELYNATAATVDLSGWTIGNANAAVRSALPAGTSLASGQFALIIAASGTTGFWSIPASAKVITLGSSSIAGGFSAAGDALVLRNSSGVVIDSVGWGTNTTIFNPDVPAAASGFSMMRKNLSQDTNSAVDWTNASVPTPGR